MKFDEAVTKLAGKENRSKYRIIWSGKNYTTFSFGRNKTHKMRIIFEQTMATTIVFKVTDSYGNYVVDKKRSTWDGPFIYPEWDSKVKIWTI